MAFTDMEELEQQTMDPQSRRQAQMNHQTVPQPSASKSLSIAHLNAFDWVSMALMIVGGLNWGMVGVFNLDLVASIFGPMTEASRVVYGLVGLSALYGIFMVAKLARRTRPM